MPESLSISIPAYNEEATLEPLVRESVAVLRKLTSDFEVLIIDDGSSDKTATIADRLAGAIPQVRVLHHERNLGFGRTLKDVFMQPSKELIFFIPGDGQIPPGELETLLPQAASHDFVLGWRTQRRDTLLRRWASFLYNSLISLLLRRIVHDVNSVALVRRSMIQTFSLKSQSAFLHAELLLKTAKQGYRWCETPIGHRERVSGKSKAFRLRVMLSVLRDLLRGV